ncbi:MAG: 2-oxo acid dehydrogenase subunit E2 [Alphaproteobacteria bacterium]|nr:MAG: 2-oxo acid dehydrogenase subunit E2 [Alphaproteobacteria bacterium]
MADMIAVAMPKWGLEMTEGTVVKVHVGEGDTVSKGQTIMDIETEKIANEFEAEAAGVIKKIMVAEGDVKIIGDLMAVIGPAEATDAEVEEFIGSYVSVAVGRVEAAPAAAAPAAAPAVSSAPAADDSGVKASPPAKRLARKLDVDIALITGTGRGGRISADDVQAFADAGGAAAAAPAAGGEVRATPGAKRLAKELGIDLATIAGSGRGGRISKEDVEAAGAGGDAGSYGSTPVAAPAAQVISGDNPATVEPLSSMRKTIAKRLTESKQNTPHIYLTVDVEIDKLLARRAKYNATASVKTSLNDFVIRAAGLALKQVPKANVQYHGDELHFFEHADISVAVAIDGGLITPIVRAANLKTVEQISIEMKDLAARAREGKLKLDEIQGGTFSITNLGMYGIKSFDAVINPPQGAILAIGTGEERLVAKNGAPAVATVMTVTMSCDHRSIDGALGAQFLDAFKELLEEPLALTV